MTPYDEVLLVAFANDAFEVMNWARRQGLKRDEQVEQVVAAFKKRLLDFQIATEPASEEQ